MDEHARRVILRVLATLDATESGEVGPDDLLTAVRGATDALDNANSEWRSLLFELSLAIDAALDPWPRPEWFDERDAVMRLACVAMVRDAAKDL